MEIMFSLEWEGVVSSLPPGLLIPEWKLLKTQQTFDIQKPENLRLTLQEIMPSYE